MKNSNLSKKEKICILLADEMKIKKAYTYDKKEDSTLKPSNYVQVIMARGIIGNWKQPIYYSFDTCLSKDLIFEIIKKLEAIEYSVAGITTDLGGSNRGLWNDLGISTKKTWFVNPVNGKNVYVFGDVPHLIKLFRNHFLDSGFLFNDKIINAAPIAELLNLTSTFDLKIVHKINMKHLTCKNAERQKVKLATQLFSHTVSCALTRAASLGLTQSHHVLECADLVKKINDWFDVFNSKVPESSLRDRVKAYGLCLETQNKILENMEDLTRNMKVLNKRFLLPFQKGILISISSLKLLYSDLQSEYDIRYILTYRLNQDPLEGFFSIMRAIGGLHDHPTNLEFKFRIRNYLLGRNDQIISEYANIESNDTADLDFSNQISMQIPPNISLDENEYDEINTITAELLHDLYSETQCFDNTEIDDNLSELEWDGLEHLAGYIAFKLHDKTLGAPTDKSSYSAHTWISHLSEGGLYKPTENFMRYIKKLDNIFKQFNNPSIKICRRYIEQLMNLAQPIEISNEAKRLFFRCRMYFKIRILNKEFTENIKKRKYLKIVH